MIVTGEVSFMHTHRPRLYHDRPDGDSVILVIVWRLRFAIRGPINLVGGGCRTNLVQH